MSVILLSCAGPETDGDVDVFLLDGDFDVFLDGDFFLGAVRQCGVFAFAAHLQSPEQFTCERPAHALFFLPSART